MHVAAEGGRAEAVDELLRWDPGSLLAEDFRGHQPIHHAAYHGHADVVEVLLRHGAEVHPGKKRGAGKRGTDGDLIHHDGAQGAGSPLQGVADPPTAATANNTEPPRFTSRSVPAASASSPRCSRAARTLGAATHTAGPRAGFSRSAPTANPPARPRRP